MPEYCFFVTDILAELKNLRHLSELRLTNLAIDLDMVKLHCFEPLASIQKLQLLAMRLDGNFSGRTVCRILATLFPAVQDVLFGPRDAYQCRSVHYEPHLELMFGKSKPHFRLFTKARFADLMGRHDPEEIDRQSELCDESIVPSLEDIHFSPVNF